MLATDVIPQATTRLAAGQEVKLINIGLNGTLLIQSSVILAPGSPIRLRLKIPGALMTMEGRIQRSRVIGLLQAKVKYEAAIILDSELPQPLVERLQFLDEDGAPAPSQPFQGIGWNTQLLPDTAELWVLEGQQA